MESTVSVTQAKSLEETYILYRMQIFGKPYNEHDLQEQYWQHLTSATHSNLTTEGQLKMPFTHQTWLSH